MAPLPRTLAAFLLAALAAATTGDEARLEFKHTDGTVANAIESAPGSLELQVNGSPIVNVAEDAVTIGSGAKLDIDGCTVEKVGPGAIKTDCAVQAASIQIGACTLSESPSGSLQTDCQFASAEPPPPPPPLSGTSCEALLAAHPDIASGVYIIDGQAAFCDMVSFGGGWQKIMPIPGCRLDSKSADATSRCTSSSYDLLVPETYIRIDGIVDSGGNALGAFDPIPHANEYFWRYRQVQAGAGQPAGSITYATEKCKYYNEGCSPESQRRTIGSHMANGDFAVQLASRSEDKIRYWSSLSSNGGSLASLGEAALANLHNTPSDSGGDTQVCAAEDAARRAFRPPPSPPPMPRLTACLPAQESSFGVDDRSGDLYYHSWDWQDNPPNAVWEIEAYMRG